MSHTPNTACTGVSQAQQHRLQNFWEIQAENRYKTLWSSKQNGKVAAHENWIQTKKNQKRLNHRSCLGHPGDPGQMLEADGPSLTPQALPEVSLQACPEEGTGAGHRTLLKKVLSGKAPSL